MTDDGKLKWFDSYSDHPTHGKPDDVRYQHDIDWAEQKVLDLFADDAFTPGACVILSGMLEGMARMELDRMGQGVTLPDGEDGITSIREFFAEGMARSDDDSATEVLH